MLVRFEDLVFHAEETVTKVCECAGGKRTNPNKFHYIVESAKKGIGAHGKERTGYVDALIRYGSLAKRYKGYDSLDDLTYIKNNVDPTLMNLMKYGSIDPSWLVKDKRQPDGIKSVGTKDSTNTSVKL